MDAHPASQSDCVRIGCVCASHTRIFMSTRCSAQAPRAKRCAEHACVRQLCTCTPPRRLVCKHGGHFGRGEDCAGGLRRHGRRRATRGRGRGARCAKPAPRVRLCATGCTCMGSRWRAGTVDNTLRSRVAESATVCVCVCARAQPAPGSPSNPPSPRVQQQSVADLSAAPKRGVSYNGTDSDGDDAATVRCARANGPACTPPHNALCRAHHAGSVVLSLQHYQLQ